MWFWYYPSMSNEFISESLDELILARCQNSDLQRAAIWMANLANAQDLVCDRDEVAVNACLMHFKTFVETTDPDAMAGTERLLTDWMAK